MVFKNKILEKIQNMCNGLEGLCMDEYIECSNELIRLDMSERRITDGCSMETIARALNKLKQETGYGVRDDKDKQQKSEREKTTELCEGYIEGNLPAIT